MTEFKNKKENSTKGPWNGVVRAEFVNIREEPSIESAAIRSVRRGKSVKILSESGDFFEIEVALQKNNSGDFEKIHGYILSELIKLDKEENIGGRSEIREPRENPKSNSFGFDEDTTWNPDRS